MTDAAVPRPEAYDGVTARLWRTIRGPVDLTFVDAGASGELLAARTRVHIAVLLLAINLLTGWTSGAESAISVLVAAHLAYALFARRAAGKRYSIALSYATTMVDVSCVTAALAFMCFTGDVTAPLRSIVRFPLYFLAILLSSLKMNWRLSALSGLLCVAEYASLLAAIHAAAPDAANWTLQIGRLGTLLCAGYLGTVIVLRAQQLRELSTRDFLTGLANRAVLDGRLAEELSRARRHRRRLALALLDIDHFKRFNDTHGHPCGDAALRALSDVLRSSVRDSDLVARYGGEEFALLLPEAGLAEARAKLEALRLMVEGTEFGDQSGAEMRLTLSAGVAAFPADADSVASLTAAADARLYEAKRAGRNRVMSGATTGPSRCSALVVKPV